MFEGWTGRDERRVVQKMSLKNVKSKSEMFKNHWLYKWPDPVLKFYCKTTGPNY